MNINRNLSFCFVVSIFFSGGILFPFSGKNISITSDMILREGSIITNRDYWPTTGWMNSTPEAQGIDSTKLYQMNNYIDDYYSTNFPGESIHSVVAIRNGYIVFEQYPHYNYSLNNIHKIYSITKSVISILIGIAINRGYIEGIDQKVLSFFPNRTIAHLDESKQGITIEHLLTMTSGLDLTLPWFEKEDPIQGVLDLPMEHHPGGHWCYSNGPVELLSAIIAEATGNTTLEFAQQYLFEPLGIFNVEWMNNSCGMPRGGDGLKLKPRDIAKLAYLYLNMGTWDEEQIIPSEWVYTSTSTHIYPSPFNNLDGYGYLWWTYPQLNIYLAVGFLGQRLFVFPDYDFILVFTADKNIPLGQELFYRYIIPALSVKNLSTPRNTFETILLFVSGILLLFILLLVAVVLWKKLFQ